MRQRRAAILRAPFFPTHPPGAAPGGVIARVTQVEGIDYGTSTVSIRGPQGHLRKFTVSEDIENFDRLQVGDIVGLRVTEAMAMTMIAE
jgi:hypothetical protein